MRLLVLLTALLLAGCAAPVEERAARAPAYAPVGEEERAPLVALPANTVSSGAEPMILAARDGTLYVGDTSGLSKSTDGGVTWQDVDTPFFGGLFTDGFALAEDEAGTLYVAVTNGQMISMGATDDGGASWRVNHLVDASTIADRPWIAARGEGEVAIVYNDLKTTREACLHSTDGGATFLPYLGIVATPNAGNLVFDDDGKLYYSLGNVAYRWDTPCLGEPKRLVHGAVGGAQTFTTLAVDDDGALFVAGPDTGNDRMLLVGRSGAGGQWRSLTISAPEARSNTYATVSEQDGEVAVAWYASDTPGNPADPAFDGSWNVQVARVTGFFTVAPSIERIVVTGEPNHVGDFCMAGISCTNGDRDLLDYFGLDHGPDGALHVAYGHDGAGGNAEVRYATVAP